VIEAACRHGKHILCQKPMATTRADCDRIIKAVDDSGVHFQMAFQMRCDPLNQKIKEWVESGAVGRIGSLRRRHCINFLFNSDLPNSAAAWHISPEKNVGMFFDDAVHAADFMYWLLGKPQSVMAEIDNTLTSIAPDDTGIAITAGALNKMARWACSLIVYHAGGRKHNRNLRRRRRYHPELR
jgi:predicted dehydrogenase